MLSERKTSAKKTKVFSINHQTHEKLSSITKLNNQKNSKVKKLENIFITPLKLQKYAGLNTKNKIDSKDSTRTKTTRTNKTKESINNFKPSYSLYKLSKINLTRKYPSFLNTFYNSKLNHKIYSPKSRSIGNKLKKTSTSVKKNTSMQCYPISKNLSNISLLNSTKKKLNSSYKKFFMNKKKIKITSTEKKNINKKNILKTDRCSKNKKINLENNNNNNKMIKSIFDVKHLQNKIQNLLNKRCEKIVEKLDDKNIEHIDEFSFKQDYIVDNYYNENNFNQKFKNNNDIEINLDNKKVLSNLIQSNIISSLPESERNKTIYEENYNCDTPQFNTLEIKDKIIF